MKRVLSVGQCIPDGTAIAALLGEHFNVDVVTASTAAEAELLIEQGPFDLVLVNRVFDADGGSGTELIRKLKAGENRAVPLMLVTNYPEHDAAAVELGAVSGFGKAALRARDTIEKLAVFLAE